MPWGMQHLRVIAALTLRFESSLYLLTRPNFGVSCFSISFVSPVRGQHGWGRMGILPQCSFPGDTGLLQLFPLLLRGLNILHPLWSDIGSSLTAGMLLSILTKFFLCLNLGKPIHFHNSTSSFSCVYMSLCLSSILLDFSWFRSISMYGSDHYPIFLAEGQTSIRVWNFDEEDWWLGIFAATEFHTFRSYLAQWVMPIAFSTGLSFRVVEASIPHRSLLGFVFVLLAVWVLVENNSTSLLQWYNILAAAPYIIVIIIIIILY